MKKPNTTNKHFLALSLILSSLFIANNASATQAIFAIASSKGITAPSCTSCHTNMNGSKANLKTNYQAAYNLDKANLTKLKNLIMGCANGQIYSLAGFSCLVPATVSGSVGSATSGASATDVYAVTCGAGTSKFYVAVKDAAPAKAPVVSVQAVKGYLATPLSSDATDGDVNYSPAANVAGSAGVFNLQVNKQLSSVVGAEAYTAEFVCVSAAGAKTTTSAAVIKQQQ
jgi:hypothetical protein